MLRIPLHSQQVARPVSESRAVQLSIAYNLRFKRSLPTSIREKTRRGDEMLWTIFVILLVLWLLGVVSSYTMGGFIHILLVLAVIALIFQLISGRRTVV
jgi:hypothetical protein